MSGFSRFGDYVLLRKLDESGLGESYRAGRLDEDGALNDVAMLRLFNGAGLDADRLVANLRPSPVAGAGPGLPQLQTSGLQAGICFIAYEYGAGKDLATLMQRANDGFSTLAMEHALLVAERVAKGLAWLHREHEVAHGFLVPPLVRVSEEGETKLHGFEVGPALAAHAASGAIDPAFRAYLSPEVLGGASPGPRDDVFSLGALLLQLLTGTPPGAEEGVSARLQRARLIENEQAIPAALQQLIADSLAPPAVRQADARAWHEQLGAWMVEGGVRATNFDLAFFVQELFRDELKRETDQRDDERKRLLTPVASEPPALVPVLEPESKLATPVAVPTAGRSRTMMMPLVAAIVLLGLAAWLLVPRFLPKGVETPVSDPSLPLSTDATLGVDGTGELGEGVQEDELADGEGSARVMSLDAASEDLEKLISERAAALEERLASEYDKEIAAMRSQLETARKVEAEARAGLTAASKQAAEPAEAEEATAAVAPVPTVEQPADPAATTPPAVEERPTTSEAEVAVSAASPQSTDQKSEASPEPLPPAVLESSPPVQVPTVVAPRLTGPPKPRYPAAARNAKRSAIVVVKVLVGRDGRVIEAGTVSDKMVGYGFDQAAINAARKAVYKPATVGGKPVEQWTTLVIRFEP